MILLDKFFNWAGFVCIAVVALVSPWLFAAWEMWYFWPFVVLIFLATFFFSLRLFMFAFLLRSSSGDGEFVSWAGEGSGAGVGLVSSENRLLRVALVLSFLVFLAYAFVRFMQADVFMDAEKSFMLFLTPFLLGVQIVFGFDGKQSKMLARLVLANLLLLGLYGVINHLGWKSAHVLWRPGYIQYQMDGTRATGSYFCPDHFSGIMELAVALGFGVIFTRGESWRNRVFAVIVALVGLVGVVLSKSRGGGLAVVVVGAVLLVIGFMQWPVVVRWYWRAVIGGLALMLLIGFCHYESSYMTRFKEHFGWSQLKGRPVGEVVAGVKSRLVASCRGQMISGALRAWKDKPVFGIGPGMHQNLWPHYAPSSDGNRELNAWPTFPNNEFHSYEVHCDWVQLLEEYGVVGLLLFLLPLAAVIFVLGAGIRREVEDRRNNDWERTGNDYYAAVLGAVLAIAAMGFHSLGDFNLQMPATVWLMAVIIAIPVGCVLNDFSCHQ